MNKVFAQSLKSSVANRTVAYRTAWECAHAVECTFSARQGVKLIEECPGNALADTGYAHELTSPHNLFISLPLGRHRRLQAVRASMWYTDLVVEVHYEMHCLVEVP